MKTESNPHQALILEYWNLSLYWNGRVEGKKKKKKISTQAMIRQLNHLRSKTSYKSLTHDRTLLNSRVTSLLQEVIRGTGTRLERDATVHHIPQAISTATQSQPLVQEYRNV